MGKKADILLVLVVLVVSGVILSNLVIAKAPQYENNKTLLGMHQTSIQSTYSPSRH